MHLLRKHRPRAAILRAGERWGLNHETIEGSKVQGKDRKEEEEDVRRRRFDRGLIRIFEEKRAFGFVRFCKAEKKDRR